MNHVVIAEDGVKDEDPNTRKSTNYHSLNQTINHEIKGQAYHEDINSKLKKLKPKTKIKNKVNEDDEWESAEITKRAAKASEKKLSLVEHKKLFRYKSTILTHQTGTNNRGLKPMLSEKHEIWHRGSYCKDKEKSQI